MSAPYIIPFNHQPVGTGAGSSTYTVPAGKYARLSFTCNASIFATLTATAGNFTDGNSSFSDTVSGSVWLKSGDIITVSNSNASGSFTNSGASTVAVNPNGTSSATILLNGVAFSSARANGSFPFTTNSSGTTVTLNGTTQVQFIYEEYNVIS